MYILKARYAFVQTKNILLIYNYIFVYKKNIGLSITCYFRGSYIVYTLVHKEKFQLCLNTTWLSMAAFKCETCKLYKPLCAMQCTCKAIGT